VNTSPLITEKYMSDEEYKHYKTLSKIMSVSVIHIHIQNRPIITQQAIPSDIMKSRVDNRKITAQK